MSSSIRMIIVSLLSILFLSQGCSSGGGSSSGTTSTGDQVSIQSGLFSIEFEDENIEIFDYELSIKRGENELTDTLLEYISYEKKSDGSVVVTLKEVVTNGISEGLTTLEIGDIITLEAKGYTPQQFVVDENMLSNSSGKIALKAIESRQTYNLADMVAGADSVTPKSARGATTRVTDEGVVFETLHSGVSLTLPTMTYERLVRKISRLPRSNPDTQVHIDMTSIDPRTEHSATIGDFSYDPDSEPSDERTTNATGDDSQTALESVVMADMRMTTDSGDEIHCFDGEYDPATNTCSGDAKATLKMQIPESQFNQYAQKYNDGDRVVPLYAYNKVKATWARQLGSDGKGLDAELMLTDNDSNQKANAGDILILVGQVGHFSWWNGDYPVQRTCLDVKVDLSGAPEASSYIQVKGVDYTGRVFKKYLNADTTEVKSISAKENSIVSIELIMSDGSVGDSLTYATTTSEDGVCEIVGETLTAPDMNTLTLDVTVKDTQGNLLKGAYVRTAGQYKYTDSNGSVQVNYSYGLDSNLSETINVSYYTGNFTATDKREITQDTTGPIVFELDIEESLFQGKVVESINGVTTAAAGAYVQVYNYNPYYSKSVKTDSNGSFEINLPASMVEEDLTASIYIYKYNSDYAFYPRYSKEITLSPDLGTFDLAFDTHTVSGQVSDTQGEAIANARVYTRGGAYKNARSDENGNYEFIILGESDVNVSVQAYTYKEKYLYSNKEYFITQAAGTTNQNLTIDLRKAIIKGRVLTSNGIALENMRIYWSKDYYNYVLTDADGYFSLETYSDGDGYIRVYDTATYSYLDFDANTDVRDVELNGVEVGKIYDLENLLVVEKSFAPIISEITIDPNTPLVDVPFEVNIDAYDPDADNITYSVEEYYGRDAATISISENIATVTVGSRGYYYFKVTVTDVHGNASQKRVSVYVKDHVRPVIDSVTYVYPNNKRYFDKTTSLEIKTEAHSAEGNALSYSYELVSLSSDNLNGVVDTNASDASQASIPTSIVNGKYRLVVTVNDVYNETTTRRYITIDSTVAPEIDAFSMNGVAQTSVAIKENTTVNFDINLTDAVNVSNTTWYWYINGQTYNTQNIDPVTFANEGYFYGYVTVRDLVGRSDSQSFYINVQADAKPVIDSVNVTPSIVTKIGESYRDSRDNTVNDLTLSITAHDDDSNSLTYSFAKLGVNDAVVTDNNATYLLSGLSVGRHSIKVTVSDATSSVDTFVNIEVLKDSPPVITEFRVPLATKVSTTVKLYASATEPNGQALTYEWSATSGNLLNATSQSASLEVSSVAQDINVTLKVSDGTNEVSRARTLKVLENSAPIIEYFSLRTLAVTLDNQKIDLKSIYGDIDGSIESAKYVLFDENNNSIAEKIISQSDVVTSWELAVETFGNYKVYLEVTDDNNAISRSEKANLVVEKPNSAPVITSLTATSVSLLMTEETTLNVVATDPDGDAVSIVWSANGGSIVADSTTADRATFSTSSIGEYTITAIATDTSGAKAIQTLVITVSSATLSVTTVNSSYILGSDVSLTATMSSEHTIPSSTSWSVVDKPDNSSLTTSSTGASITVTPDVVGTYKVKANTVINGVSFSAEKSFSVQAESTAEADLEGVVKSDTGDTLSGAQVRLYNKTDSTIYDVTVITDSTGAYSFSVVPTGSYYLVVYAGNGYVSQTQIIEIN